MNLVPYLMKAWIIPVRLTPVRGEPRPSPKLRQMFKKNGPATSSDGDPDPEPDPDPLDQDRMQDPHAFGPPGSGSISQRYVYGSGSESFPFLIKVLSGLK